MTEPHWIDRMVEDVTSTILTGLDHTLSHAPARILLAKGALERLTAAVRRWAVPKAQLLEQLRSELDAELCRKQLAAQNERELAIAELRGEFSNAQREMYKDQASAYAEQAAVWSEARMIVRKIVTKANSE